MQYVPLTPIEDLELKVSIRRLRADGATGAKRALELAMLAQLQARLDALRAAS